MIIESTAGFAARHVPRAGLGSPFRCLFSLIVGLAPIILVIGGCDDGDLPPGISKKAVSFDEVPEALRAAARKTVPGVKFEEAWQNLDGQGKLHSYEIRGKQASSGKIREVRISPTGEILESE